MAKKVGKQKFLTLIDRFSGPAKTSRFWSTGFYALNYLMTRKPNGGFPRGQFSVMWGTDGSAKTTVALSACGLAAEQGARIMYIDSESRLQMDWAARFGVTFVRTHKEWTPGTALLFSSKDGHYLSVEEVLDLLEAAMRADEDLRPHLIVIDSIYAFISANRAEGTAWDQFMGNEAKAWSGRMPLLTALADMNDVTVIGINQARESLDAMSGKWVFPRGQAWKSHPSVRLRLRYDSQATGSDKEIPAFAATLEKSSVGGIKGKETRFQLRPTAKLPIDVAYDLVMAGKECLFTSKTGLPWRARNMYVPRNGELIDLGDSVAKATARLAGDPELARHVMELLDHWEPRDREVTGEIPDDMEEDLLEDLEGFEEE